MAFGVYNETKYKKVLALSEDTSGGFIIPLNQIVGIKSFVGNGMGSSSYVVLVWDWNGPNEQILCSTKDSVVINFDPTLNTNQIIGDGVKKLQLVLINTTSSTSPVIGGSYEAFDLN